MNEYVVIYGKVTEDKILGVLFTYPFYGGEAETMQGAEELAKKLVNDKTQQAIVIPHIFHKTPTAGLSELIDEATKRFRRMEEDMYDCEEIYEKRGKPK